MLKLRPVFFAIQLALAFQALSAQPVRPFVPLLFNEAFTEGVSGIAADDTNSLFAVASEDGSVRIYADAGQTLLQQFQCGPYPVVRVALGDESLATVERLPQGQFRLGVWNFRQGRQLYSVEVAEPVLSLGFSPAGNYLVASLARWNSPIFLDLASGQFKPWLKDGFGMVDFCVMSGKEDRLLSYQATTGNLAYHELAGGTVMKTIPAKSRLSQLQIVPDGSKSRAVALSNGGLVTVDLVGGLVQSAKPAGFTILRLCTDAADPLRVLALGGGNGKLQLAWYRLDANGQPSLEESLRLDAELNPNTALLQRGQLFLGDEQGRLWRVAGGEKPQALALRRSSPILDAAFVDQALYLSTALGTIKLQSEAFARREPGAFTLPRLVQVPVPGIAPRSGLLAINDTEILAWESGKSPKLLRWDSRKDSALKSLGHGGGSILHASVRGDQLATVDSQGSLRLFSLAEMRQSASFPASGAFSCLLSGGGHVLVGQGATGANNATLRRITIKTGETLPLSSGGMALLQMAWLPGGETLAGILTSSEGGKAHTLLMGGNQGGLNAEWARVAGEDVGADLVASRDGQKAYTSLGGVHLSALESGNLVPFQLSPHAPRRIIAGLGLVACINADGSLSLWDEASKRLLLDLRVSANGTVFYLSGEQGVGFAERLQGTKTLPADAADQQTIFSLLAMPVSAPAAAVRNVISLPLTLE